MEIYVAKTAGFCFGVKRAINLATSSTKEGGNIYTLGSIIHNPQVVKELEDIGIHAKDSIDDVDEGTLIIRSHGAKYEDFEKAKEKGLRIVDATCPFVKKAQELVSRLTEEGYHVIVVGEREHPEVKGLVSYGAEDIRVVESPEELKDMPRRRKIGIVAQTTISMEKFEAVVGFCLRKAGEIKIFNTICNATTIRQKESVELARRVDCVIVVGGRNSANTRRLAEICRSIQPRTYHIEVPEEIDPAWFEDTEALAITAGASTPHWLIEKVVSEINSLCSK